MHFGGNAALTSLGGDARWNTSHILLGEPSIRREEGGRLIGTSVGTSFATPHVTHLAAAVAESLKQALGRPPSANLIRCAVASTAEVPPCGAEWLGSEQDQLKLVGYGIPNDQHALWSSEQRVQLAAEDAIPEDSLHIFRVPVPNLFLSERGRRGIIAALAFDPPVRASRKEYLSRTMWFDLIHGQTPDEIQRMRGRYTGDDDAEVPTGSVLGLRPPKTATMWSTLQVRQKIWSSRPRFRIVEGNAEPALYLVVGCQRRYETGLEPIQSYAVVVSLWHESERVTLYHSLRTAIRVPAVRVRAQA
jgi:hypothetical protein